MKATVKEKRDGTERAFAIQVAGATCRYGAVEVLQGIEFVVASGEYLGIIGPNGSGKSTLLKALSAVLKPVTGTVYLNQKEISGYSARDLAREMAVVPQDTAINFDFTALDVVLMGRHPHLGRWQAEGPLDLDVARRAMQMTGTWDLRDRSILELSGGERQRVIIARALTQEPKVILLDEPTAHLDINHQMEILEVVRRLNREQGLTVVAVLHDLNLAGQYCQKLLLLSQGRVFACGTPREVITADNIRTVYRTEVLVEDHPLTGAPRVTVLTRTPADTAPASDFRVHLIGGGGTARYLLEQLTAKGYRVTAGVLNIGDSDWETARILGLTVAEEAPFSPVGDQACEFNRELVTRADIVFLLNIPFGNGNLKNLQVLESALEKGIPVYAIDGAGLANRDYTGGQATAIYKHLQTLGLAELENQTEIFGLLETAAAERVS